MGDVYNMNACLVSVLLCGTFVFATALPVENDSNDPVIGVFEAASQDLEVDANEASVGQCCHFPTNPIHTGSTVTLNGGVTRNPGTGGFHFEHEGEAFAASISSGKIVMQCTAGSAVKEAGATCGLLPISDSSTWNALGFDLPSIELGFFGLTFDVSGQLMENMADAIPASWSKSTVVADAVRGANSGDTPDSGGGMCFAYQNWASGCGGGFAFAQSGLLSAKCGISASVVYCGPNPPTGGPSVTLSLLSGGFSPARDLSQDSFIGFWKGGDLATALATPLSARGVLSLMGSITFDAFDFAGMEIEVSVVGQMMVDVKVSDPVPKIKAILKSMFSGDLKGLVTNAKNAIPPFQLTMSGAVTIGVTLGSGFEFEMSPGSAGFTLGYGMNSDTNGFSDGVYAAANFNMCVTDMVPPLAHSFFKCGGRAIFQNICRSASVAMYLNPSKGFGLAAKFSAQIVDAIQADISMSIDMGKTEMAAALQLNIAGAKANLGATIGFSYSKTQAPAPYIRVTPDVGAILSALGGMAGRVVGDLGRTVKGWFGFEEAEILLFEKQEAERAARKRSNMQTTRAKPADMGRRLLMKAEALKEGIDEEALSQNDDASVYLDTGDSVDTGDSAGSSRRRRRRWHRHHFHHRHRPHLHHRHHRHHFHHRHRPHIHHRHSPHLHHRHRPHVHIPHLHLSLSDIGSVHLKFSEASVQADMCGFHLRFKVKAECKIFGIGASGSFSINIKLDLGDMVNKVIDAIKSGFNSVKNAFTSIFEEAQLQMRQRSQQRTGQLGRTVKDSEVGDSEGPCDHVCPEGECDLSGDAAKPECKKCAECHKQVDKPTVDKTAQSKR